MLVMINTVGFRRRVISLFACWRLGEGREGMGRMTTYSLWVHWG